MLFCVNLSVQLIYRHFLPQVLVATINLSIVKYFPDLHKQLVRLRFNNTEGWTLFLLFIVYNLYSGGALTKNDKKIVRKKCSSGHIKSPSHIIFMIEQYLSDDRK